MPVNQIAFSCSLNPYEWAIVSRKIPIFHQGHDHFSTFSARIHPPKPPVLQLLAARRKYIRADSAKAVFSLKLSYNTARGSLTGRITETSVDSFGRNINRFPN